MKWIKLDERKPRICDNILFTDGNEVYAGWLESWEPLEDLIFYDPIDKEWPENITHWGLFPSPPGD